MRLAVTGTALASIAVFSVPITETTFVNGPQNSIKTHKVGSATSQGQFSISGTVTSGVRSLYRPTSSIPPGTSGSDPAELWSGTAPSRNSIVRFKTISRTGGKTD